MNKFRSAMLGSKSQAPANPLVSDKNGKGAEGDRLTSVGIARDAVRGADHRDEDRHRLQRETAQVLFKGKRRDVDLINLSGGGAMISCDFSPRLWDRVDLILGTGNALECAVRWLRDDRIGLEFAHETQIDLPPAERDALLLEVIRRSFPTVTATPAAPAPEAATVVANAPAASSCTRRGDHRHPMIWTGEIFWSHDVHKVRLRNISTSGVLIDCPVDLPPGAELMLDLGEGRQLFATVSWCRSGQAGLLFAQKFDLSALAVVKPEVADGWQRPSYLDLTANQASPWADEWQRSSLEELRNELEGYLKY